MVELGDPVLGVHHPSVPVNVYRQGELGPLRESPGHGDGDCLSYSLSGAGGMEAGIHGGRYGFVLMCRGCSHTLINERAAIQNKWRRCRFVRVA